MAKLSPETEQVIATNRIEVDQTEEGISVFSTIQRIDPNIVYATQHRGDFPSFEEGVRTNTRKAMVARTVEFGSKYSRLAPLALSFADVGAGIVQRTSGTPENFEFIPRDLAALITVVGLTILKSYAAGKRLRGQEESDAIREASQRPEETIFTRTYPYLIRRGRRELHVNE